MGILLKVTFIAFLCTSIIPKAAYIQAIIIDHNCTKISYIPDSAIIQAKDNLHIAYGHTSHGSQLITGMNDLDAFMGGAGLYVWNDGPQQGFLDLDDYFVSGDLGNPDRTTWASRTRTYLDNSTHSDVNVVIWSWCGQAGTASESDINTYLNLMNGLETDYPNVKFVYMTGHLDGSGLTGNLHIRNEQIRDFCNTNGKILYDFADIETYNPDGVYFGDKNPNDNCDYDTDSNGSRDGNWAVEWQNAHTEGVDWYNCYAAHSKSLNGNLKAYAAWWLWARLAGWDGETAGISNTDNKPHNFTLHQNYPNPFNPSTTIKYSLSEPSYVQIKIYNLLGKLVNTLVDEQKTAGEYSFTWDGRNTQGKKLAGGIYFYRLTAGGQVFTKKMLYLQ